MNKVRSDGRSHGLLVVLLATVMSCSSTVNEGVRIIPSDGATQGDSASGDGATTGDGATGSDGGTTDDATPGTDAAPSWMPPAGTDPACVSGVRWTRGNRGSQLMNPGQACNACHARDIEAPVTTVAGTVYYLDHEANNCNGYTGSAPGGPTGRAYVEVVDATGATIRLAVNTAGNFYTERVMEFPLRTARVIGPTGLINEMGSEVPNGDCNSCHTQMGTTTVTGGDDAPGRIIVPL